jgi:hypothetical protein
MKHTLLTLVILLIASSVAFGTTLYMSEKEISEGFDSPFGMAVLQRFLDAGDWWGITNGTDHPIYVQVNGGPWIKLAPGEFWEFEVPAEVVIDWANGTGKTTITFDPNGNKVKITNNRNKPQVGGASYGGDVKTGQLPPGGSITIPYNGLEGFGLLD